jgi:sugar phosphate isomerase/epimerase
MMKAAFSTVACPDWTLPHIAERARAWGFEGVELRTFGFGGTRLACEPGLTQPAKTRALFGKAGVRIVSLGTSVRFDESVTPPVIGMLGDTERSVREARGAVDLAIELECPFVRVYGFEIVGGESRKSASARIAARLAKAADHCRNSGVRLLVENGGSFPRAADVAGLIDAAGSELVGASYSLAVAMGAGEDPAAGVNVLSDRLEVVKIKDMRGGVPCALGEGELRAHAGVAALQHAGYDGWVVFEHDRLWFPGAPEADAVMESSARTLYQWIGGKTAALV